jgi:hypothetical protein
VSVSFRQSVNRFFAKAVHSGGDEAEYREVSAFWFSWLVSSQSTIDDVWAEKCVDLLTGISMYLARSERVTFDRVCGAIEKLAKNRHPQAKLVDFNPNDGSVGANVLPYLCKTEPKIFASCLAIIKLSVVSSQKGADK